MDRVISAGSVAVGSADAPPVTGTPQYFTSGNPGTDTPATVLPGYWCNAIQEELMAVIVAAGITPDRTNNAQLLAAIRLLGRVRLSANTNFYVSTAGNDSTGNGTIGSPWATLQHAVNYIQQNIDLNSFTATILVSAGTYAPVSLNGRFTGNGTVQLTGDTATPDNCIISTSTNNQNCISVSLGGILSVSGFKLTSTGTGGNGIRAVVGGTIIVNGNMDFGACNNAHIHAIDSGSYISLSTSYTISGSATLHLYAAKGGEATSASTGITGTLTGSPSFSGAFASCEKNAIVDVDGLSFSGAATGTRFSAISNGVINTNGGGANYLPGSIAGTTATGGQYI